MTSAEETAPRGAYRAAVALITARAFQVDADPELLLADTDPIEVAEVLADLCEMLLTYMGPGAAEQWLHDFGLVVAGGRP